MAHVVQDGAGLVRALFLERFPEYAEDDELVERLGQLIVFPFAGTDPRQQDASDRFLDALENLTGEDANIGRGIVLQRYGGVMEYTYGSHVIGNGIGELTIKLHFLMKP